MQTTYVSKYLLVLNKLSQHYLHKQWADRSLAYLAFRRLLLIKGTSGIIIHTSALKNNEDTESLLGLQKDWSYWEIADRTPLNMRLFPQLPTRPYSHSIFLCSCNFILGAALSSQVNSFLNKTSYCPSDSILLLKKVSLVVFSYKIHALLINIISLLSNSVNSSLLL